MEYHILWWVFKILQNFDKQILIGSVKRSFRVAWDSTPSGKLFSIPIYFRDISAICGPMLIELALGKIGKSSYDKTGNHQEHAVWIPLDEGYLNLLIVQRARRRTSG